MICDYVLDKSCGLISYNNGRDCLGYLLPLPDLGVYDAGLGKVAVTPEEAEQHNQLLDQLMLQHLDASCRVGQRVPFYIQGREEVPTQVTTWTGVAISERVRVRGQEVVFWRQGKVFRGLREQDRGIVYFERVSWRAGDV